MAVRIEGASPLQGEDGLKDKVSVMMNPDAPYPERYAAKQYLVGCCKVMAKIPARDRVVAHLRRCIRSFA